MTFGWHTPPEVVAAALDEVATVLADNHDSDKHAFVRGGSGLRALFPLAQQNWTESATSDTYTFASPDGLVTAHLRLSDPPPHQDGPWHSPYLRISCATGDYLTDWEARATANTPLPVLTALTAAVASPDPLLRNSSYLSRWACERLTITPVAPAPGTRATAATRASTVVAATSPAAEAATAAHPVSAVPPTASRAGAPHR